METQKDETAKLLHDLGDRARRVARDRSDYDGAYNEAKAARADLLTAIIDAVKPALPALCSGVPLLWSYPKISEGPVIRALQLTQPRGPAFPVRFALATDSRRGRYGGTALYLTDHGQLIDMSFDGPWSDVPGEVSSWEAKWSPLTAQQATEEYDIHEIIDRLTTALVEEAKGKRPMRTASLLTRARQLQALTTMLRGMK